MTAPVMRAYDVLYPRFRVPDLDQAEEFLRAFGLVRVERTAKALHMAGAGTGAPLHVVERGDATPAVGLAFRAADASDLERLSRCDGASAVHEVDEPGGGSRVTLTDPHGFAVEVVYRPENPLHTSPPSLPLNLGPRVERLNAVKRLPRAAARIHRLGHLGINTPNVSATYDWYHHHLGLVKSDVVCIGETELVNFCRCDRGPEASDHHAFLIAVSASGRPSFNHAAWEVSDLDDVWLGHEELRRQGHRHHWGIGRHTLGSQVFDYWRDPWGNIHEHFTDGDLLDDSHPVGVHQPDGAGSQWGPEMPPDFGQPLVDAPAGER